MISALNLSLRQMIILILLIGGIQLRGQTQVSGKEVTYFGSGEQAVSGYLAEPADSGSHPAIILIHEWWGLNDDIRAKARSFADLGYVALAVDLYHGASTTDPQEARQLVMKVQGDLPGAFENLRAALQFLKEDSLVDPDRIASIGWCFGGGWSYQMAVNNLGVKASVIYYGQFNPEDDFQKMRAEIIGHFADNDRSIAVDNVKEFQARLKTANGEHEIYIYPNTTHGFASRPGVNPQYSEAAAKLAWERTIAFLKKHL